MNRDTKFWDKVADKYSRQPIKDEAAYQKKLEVTRTYFRPDMNVLEIGCGTGSTAISHAPFVSHIRATDISGNMIDIARRKAAAANVSNVDFEQVSIDALSAPDKSLDVVLGMSILHLLENMDDVVAKVHRMLKPGGFFITSTVCLGDTMPYFKLILPVGRFFGVMPYVSVFSRAHLENALTSAGFTIEYNWRPNNKSAVFIVAKKHE
ncbi:MAG: class I SAM-dependent methyltransferase [Pseudomonadota bacterium]